jgi:CheY-like chemotaxis protein
MQTILVVDDSASIRHQTQKLVEAAGFKCITANNGADALELLLNGDFEPDLILSDVEMPQIDGWQFLEYIKTDENLGHIPIVLVTSLDADEHRTRAFDLGAADYIVKPLNSDSFEKVTENLLSAVIA